jgi:ubiquitin C-terminal hydrolase
MAAESSSTTATEKSKSLSLSSSASDDAAIKKLTTEEVGTTTTAAFTVTVAPKTPIVHDSSSLATASTDKVVSSVAPAVDNDATLQNNSIGKVLKEACPLDETPSEMTTAVASSSSSMNVVTAAEDNKEDDANGADSAAVFLAKEATNSSSTLPAAKEGETMTAFTTTSAVKVDVASSAAATDAAAATTTTTSSPTPSSIPSATESSSTSPAKTTTTPSVGAAEAAAAAAAPKTETTKTLKSTPTHRKTNKYLLSDSQFRRYQSSEDSLGMLRRSLLAKRISVIPTSNSSGVGATASGSNGGAVGNKSTPGSAKKKSTASSTAKGGGNTTAKNKKGKDSGASSASSSTSATITNSTKATMHLYDMAHFIKPQPMPTIVVSNVLEDGTSDKKLGYDNNGTTIIMTPKEQRQEENAYIAKMQNATRRVELWMHYYRFSQGAYYDRCRRRKQQRQAAAFASSCLYRKPIHPMSSFFGAAAACAIAVETADNVSQQQESFCCHACHRSVTNIFDGDDNDEGDHDDNLMQCLECNFVGCYNDDPTPSSEVGNTLPNGRHIQQHMALSNHCFAVTCGRAARIYCFKCGEGGNSTIKWASHVVFEQEKERIQLTENLPFMAWKEHPVQRSFDPLQFMRVSPPDQGIIWKGMVATYPVIVPPRHLQAARRCRYRQILFDGGPIEDILFFWNKTNANSIVQQQQQLVARDFLEFQQRRKSAARRGDDSWWKIRHPIGMFNLGSTCFQSAVFQCLVHCSPLQKYFLRDVGHHYAACAVYNASVKSTIPLRPTYKNPKSSKSSGVDASLAAKLAAKKNKHSCLASELDKLILDYYGSSIGMNVTAALRACDNIIDDTSMESPGPRKKTPAAVIGSMLGINNNTSRTLPTAASSAVATVQQGDPLITADILAETWKCTEMAGYAQKDAHEFLHAFLDVVGKHARRFRAQVYQCIHSVDSSRGALNFTSKKAEMPMSSPDINIVKTLFEGTLRSVLLCQECGNKRTQSEQFLSISLPLSKEFQKTTTAAGKPGEASMSPVGNTKLSVERCLRHFTLPEMLADSVDCPSCGKKTPTKKQHVVSKLPRVLCLHLKRFDAQLNKKIEDHVSFPIHNFNMGSFLPHWCEVTSVPTSDEPSSSSSSRRQQDSNSGEHQAPPPQLLYNLFGTVNHFGNMQSGHYVANVNVDGSWYHCNDAHVSQTTEADVVKSDAYLLFYIRQ